MPPNYIVPKNHLQRELSDELLESARLTRQLFAGSSTFFGSCRVGLNDA